MIWLMLNRGPGDWKFVKAEPPCKKGEIRMSLRWVNITIGWQKQ